MYEDMIRVLRHCGNPNVSCKGCSDEDDCIGADGAWEIGAMANMRAAAEAIEELVATVGTAYNELANNEANKPRWIPVTERLPDEFQPVWVACKMDGRENWTFDTVYDPYLKCPWGPYYYLEKGEAVVYAWMDRSAPEPPKEETNDRKRISHSSRNQPI